MISERKHSQILITAVKLTNIGTNKVFVHLCFKICIKSINSKYYTGHIDYHGRENFGFILKDFTSVWEFNGQSTN